MNNLRILAAVAAVGLAAVILYRVSSDQPKPQFAQPSGELMKRAVTTCDQLAKEIEDMTQVTAEIRKVLRDMEYLTCALPQHPNSGELHIPDIPRCGENGTAVLTDGGPMLTWTCVPK